MAIDDALESHLGHGKLNCQKRGQTEGNRTSRSRILMYISAGMLFCTANKEEATVKKNRAAPLD